MLYASLLSELTYLAVPAPSAPRYRPAKPAICPPVVLTGKTSRLRKRLKPSGASGGQDTYPEVGKGLTERPEVFLAVLVLARYPLGGIVGKEGAGEGLVAA